MAGSLAARVMGWQRRMGGTAGPLSASGESSNGNPVQVELFLNGSWTDITSYVMTRDGNEKVVITRGRSSESASVDPASCQFQLNNRDGRFSPRNPTGPYYGVIGRNTPLRVSVPDGLGGKSYRFWGEVTSWPQRWDITGNDVWVELEAAGLLRRLQQGETPTTSVLYRAINDPAQPALLAYWPMEDAADSTSIASAVLNGSAMQINGNPTLASYDGFESTDPLPLISSDASFVGGIARYDDPTATQVRFLMFIPPEGITDGKVVCRICQLDTFATVYWELYYNGTTHSLSLRAEDVDGANLGGNLDHTYDVRGKNVRVSIEFQENGTAITRAVNILEVNSMENFAATDTQNVTSLNRVISVSFGVASKSAVGPFGTIGLPNCSIGHVTVQNSITAVTDLGQALDPSGETAGRRFQRICAQEGIALDVIGDLDDTVAMGGESKETPVTLLTECVVADLGVMYESVETFGLGYRTRTSMYNQDPQLSLSYPASQLSGVPTPVDDLEFIKNSITATRTGSDSTGFTASLSTGDMSTEAPPAGIGTYNDPVALNVETDDDLANQAYWRLHVGTVDEARYPQITLDLSRSEITPDLYAAIIGLRAGDRIVITSPPAGQPPDTISQMLLGWSETIDNFQHIITLNCQPESPYHVGFTDNATYRIDTDGTILFSAATSSDTTLTVTPSDGQTGLWTTDSAETPWDIRVSGEVMTVTSCSSVGYDSFTRTTSSTWGTASSGQAWTEVGEAAADRSTNGASGILTLTANLTTTRRQTLVNSLTDCDVQVTVAPGQVSTGAALNAGILLRHQDTSAFYKVQLSFNTDSTVSLNLVNAFNNVGSVVTTGLTYIANDVFWLRARIDNQRVRARVWRDDGIVLPKDYWMLDVTVTSAPVAIGSVGVFGVGSVGITNVAPTLTFDSFDLLDPQTFTVTRSVNGVVKAQAAGADVRLANPAIIAL